MYLGVRLWMSDGEQLSKAGGPFTTQKDRERWELELRRLIMKKTGVAGMECILLQEISDGIPLLGLSPAGFLEEMLGSYQDAKIESESLWRFGKKFNWGESGA